MGDTIFAQATPPGLSGVAVIRISGPEALNAVGRLTPGTLVPRQASLRTLRDPGTGEPIDDALVLLFPGPASFTGETIVELQCHGSRAVIRALMDRLGAIPGLRPAQAGEFTRHALENGKLDLAQVEGLADLLVAETEAQRRQASAVASGALSRSIAGWHGELMEALALLEAVIDFGDDGVPETVLDGLPERVEAVRRALAALAAGGAAAERIRDGFTVALCGEPNVGKSTLLNRLAGRDVALTSEVPGTTRDVLEVSLDLRGLPVTLIDTAGLRETADPVERLGVGRARERLAGADLRILLVEDGVPDAFASYLQDGDLVVRAKADLAGEDGIGVSGLTGAGIERLLDGVAKILEDRSASASVLANRRQQEAVAGASSALGEALEALKGQDADIAAHHVGEALRSLDYLVGRVDVEKVLDLVFRNFCLGK